MIRSRLSCKVILVFTFFILISGCKKIDYVDLPPQLQIIVQDLNKNFVSNAVVYLFETLEDFTSKSNPIETGLTDEDGIVLFSNLKEEYYYFFVEFEGKSNHFYVSGTSQPLGFGTITVIETTIN